MGHSTDVIHLARLSLTCTKTHVRYESLTKLERYQLIELPASFPVALLLRASAFDDVASLRISSKIILRAATNGSEALRKRLLQLVKSFRKSAPNVRVAANTCRLVAPLLSTDSLHGPALSLFLVALGAIECAAPRSRGSQKRAQFRARYSACRLAAQYLPAPSEDIISSLLTTVDAYASRPSEAVAAISVLTATLPGIANFSSDHAKKFLTSLAAVALKCKPSVAHEAVRAASPALAQVPSAVAIDYLVPSMERFLVREPEVALNALAPMLLALNKTQLSKFITTSLVPALLSALKSSDSKIRDNAVELAASLAFRADNSDTLSRAIGSLCGLFKSARYAYQRIAAAQALQGLICAKSSARCGTAVGLTESGVESAVDCITEWLGSKKESNKDARVEGCQTLLLLLHAGEQLSGFELGESASCKKAADLLNNFLLDKKSNDEAKSSLLALVSCPHGAIAFSSLVDKNTLFRHLLKLSGATGRVKQEDALRCLALIAQISQSDDDFSGLVRGSALWQIVENSKDSQLNVDSTTLSSKTDAECVIVWCEWFVRENHPSRKTFMGSLYHLAVDDRPSVAKAARDAVRRLRESGGEQMAVTLMDVLWDTHFGCNGAKHVPKSSYDFNDDGRSAKLLGAVLLATVLPQIPLPCIPKVVMATHYPRLIRENRTAEAIRASRWWDACKQALPVTSEIVEEDNHNSWLFRCLEEIVGENGLKSDSDVLIETAVNAIGGLGLHFSTGPDSVFRLGIPHLQSLAQAAPLLSQEAIDAVDYARHAEKAKEDLAKFRAASSLGAGKKNSKKGGNGRLGQREQAELDRARAIEAAASSAIAKAEAGKSLANEAKLAIRYTAASLRALRSLAVSDRSRTALRIPALLGLVSPAGKHQELHEECRQALFVVAKSGHRLLRGMALELSCTLFGLEEGSVDMNDRVSGIISSLSHSVPPAFDSENFALVAPILKAALLRDPDAEDSGISSGGRGSTKRRDAIAVVRTAAQILMEHCKPEAVDAAVTAAAARAGSWAIQVMEREDGAFAAAADSLALLVGTAITPGTEQLKQVIDGVISGKSSVRDGTLSALASIPQLSSANMECPRDSDLGRVLWLARFDPDESNAELGYHLWKNYNHPLNIAEDTPYMLSLLSHKESEVRIMTASGIAEALHGDEKSSVRSSSIPQMFTIYLRSINAHENEEKLFASNKKKAVVRGRDKTATLAVDSTWFSRQGVAMTIEKLATNGSLSLKDVTTTFAFLIARGLGDPHDEVRANMSTAATAVVNAAGRSGPTLIMPMIERQLNAPTNSSSTNAEILHTDRTRENLVMCLGTLAGFLPEDDPRISKSVDQVIRCAVETPSELVQNAAARCLVPLARLSIHTDREKSLRDELMKAIWDPQATYGERRGSCYALAGLCSGLGLKAMKRMRVIEELESAVVHKDPRKKIGAFLIIETHAILLGRLFEPFTVASLPHLLMCMGDTVTAVRDACWKAAQAAVSEMSSQGVKMILPSLLSGLQERQWRTRAGAAEVLGAMAFCAPRQLAQCLPQIVPKLADALADAHTRVVEAAESAISRIAAVVRSPEVRNLSKFLLQALKDPSGSTRGAIDAMLGTEFIHAIDPASLALLIPPLHRGLRDRSSELKKRAAAIVGSMCNNVSNQADVGPYLHLLLPDLRTTLLDSIPDVRRTSARALGALAIALGETGLPDIVGWLMIALLGAGRTSHVSKETGYVGAIVVSSSAERSGAAMGLAEVSASLSEQRLEEVLGQVLAAGEKSSESREGGLMYIACLPRALGERFEDRLSLGLSSILKGLSDDSDNVREAALGAGRNLVQAYAKSSLEHLLPELMSAMKDKLWRIRHAAARLLGDFLLAIAVSQPQNRGMFGAMEPELAVSDEEANGEGDEDGDSSGADEDEQFESPEAAAAAMTTEATMKAIEEVLGWTRRNEVLAALFIIRCDVSVRVRQMGMQVWKTVVSNTPKVLREIIPTAVRQVVEGLGDEDAERRAAAGKALGDLSLKLGDKVVPQILPALCTGIRDPDASPRVRRGACEGLSELVEACPKHQLMEYASDVVNVVYEALCDTLSEVRLIASGIFASLLNSLGSMAVDGIVPKLLEKIAYSDTEAIAAKREEAHNALDALRQILKASGNKLLSIVIPRLTEEVPLTLTSARALAAAAQVSDGTFDEFISVTVDAVISTLEEPVELDLKSALENVVCSIVVSDEGASRLVMDVVGRAVNEGSPWRRAAGSRLCGCLVLGCAENYVDNLLLFSGDLYELLIRQLGDPDDDTVLASWQALLDMSTSISHTELSKHIPVIRQSLRSVAAGVTVGDESAVVAGLQLPRAPAPFVPVFCEGLLHGSPEVREQSALGLAELVEMASVASLKTFVIKMVGPLIRVMSERFPWQVKAAIIRAMTVILEKCSLMLRAFAPQLQSTFVKCLSDGSRLVRVRACAALGCLVPIMSRLEPLLNDLTSLGTNGPTPESRAAAFHGCCQVYKHAKKLPETAFSKFPHSISNGIIDEDDDVAVAAGKALGQVASRARSADEFSTILSLSKSLLEHEGIEYSVRVHILEAVACVFLGGEKVSGIAFEHISDTVETMQVLMSCVTPPIQGAACMAGARAVSLLVRSSNVGEQEDAGEPVHTLVGRISARAEYDDNTQVRVAALKALAVIVKSYWRAISICVRALVACVATSNTGLRGESERVMRKVFVDSEDLSIKIHAVELAKDSLPAEDRSLIDRRLQDLRVVTDSDDDNGF